MDNQDKIGNLRARIRFFVINTIRLTAKLSKDETGKVLLRQLIRSCTSIGANFEESTEAESTNDIIHKLSIVKKESKETKYWLELVDELYPQLSSELKPSLEEIDVLIKIFSSIITKMKQK